MSLTSSSVSVFNARLRPRNFFSCAKALFFLLTGYAYFFCLASVVLAEKEEWEAPNEAAQQVNPVESSPEVLAAGKKVYAKRCAGCHGDTGNGDGPDAADLGIHPAKLSELDPAEETDGALFWKIQTGKKPMPKYSAKLSPEEIWQVIHYLRGFRGK